MKTLVYIAVCCLATITISVAGENDWYPSPWGPDDQRGAANRQTPEKVLEAVSLIRTGLVYQLGRLYEPCIPVFGNRHYSLTIPQTFGPAGKNQTKWHDELFSGEIGQIGTQFDGLGHVGIGDLFYNGFDRREFAQSYGLEKLGIENVGPIFTRGVLIDVAALKGVSRLEMGYEITAEDIRSALARQGDMVIHPGDAVLIHTGWGSLWMVDNEQYSAGEPGIGLEAAGFLAELEIIMTASDTWSTEVVPNPDPDLAFPVHQFMLTKNGIYNLENIDTSVLALEKIYEFAFCFIPLPLKGATGSPGNPIAIR